MPVNVKFFFTFSKNPPAQSYPVCPNYAKLYLYRDSEVPTPEIPNLYFTEVFHGDRTQISHRPAAGKSSRLI